MKFTLNILEKRSEDESERRWPDYLFGGRIRTSTVVLIIAFLGGVVGLRHLPPEPAPKPPAPQVVPPGFVPDPNYTWVPREPRAAAAGHRHVHADADEPPPTPPLPPPDTTTTTTAAVPCCHAAVPAAAPFCPPSTTPTTSPSQQPQPRPGSGADFVATGQLTSRASENHRYTGVP